ncbi:melanoma-associated antigen B5 isoform X2 [Pan troglodytes]|uniref:melanoma-associated antigen B5 isoform X2 n=1 Tax=Pan troglodytes TaxID=9598 RepID=UPI0023F29226|nr:melanoma-associated antigen B5 isoform X2 [Pan troglodytes]
MSGNTTEFNCYSQPWDNEDRANMSQDQNCKLHTCEKHYQIQDGSLLQSGAQASEEVEDDPLPTSSPILGDIPQSSSAAESSGTSQEPCESSTMTSAGVFNAGSDERANSRDEEYPCSSEVSPSTESSCSNFINIKVGLLEQFLLYKFKMKQRILKEDMLKIVNPRYQNQFAEIHRRASEHIEVVFAVDLKEVNPTCHLYDLVSKLKLPNNGRIHVGKGLPKTGLLMTFLFVIFLKGNCANKEDTWKFLDMMQIYDGKKYYIYGEPRKLITQDFVRLKYLEYHQVPCSYPAHYQFLWGPRAYTETSKMKVLEYLAKVNGIAPGAFSSQYEEALQDEEESPSQRCS